MLWHDRDPLWFMSCDNVKPASVVGHAVVVIGGVGGTRDPTMVIAIPTCLRLLVSAPLHLDWCSCVLALLTSARHAPRQVCPRVHPAAACLLLPLPSWGGSVFHVSADSVGRRVVR